MGSHAPRSPSSFYQIELCPGAFSAQKDLPNLSNSEALLGTAAHEILEACLKGNTSLRDQNEVIMSGENGEEIKVDEYTMEGVRSALEYVENTPGLVSVQSEQRVNPQDFVLRGDMWGTLDIAMFTEFLGEKIIEICDFKNGFIIVEVEDNSQLIVYLLGLIAELLEADAEFDPNEYAYKITIIQPRAHHALGPIRSAEYTYSELLVFADKYAAIAEYSDKNPDERAPGTKQCRYCRAKLVCKELKQYALLAVRAGGIDPRYEAEVTLEDAILRHPSSLSADEIKYLLDVKPLVTSFFKAVEVYAGRCWDKGKRDFGYKKVQGRKTKYWRADAEDTLARLKLIKGEAGVAVPDRVMLKPPTLATASQVLTRVKALKEPELTAEVTKLIGFGHEGAKLVPSTDSAPSIAVDAADHFKPE